ncbi:hypothetical protein WJX82_006047 [Trebouxia sp. C0006]
MDPRRVSELSEAAASGAARRAAADARQRSIQEAMARAREHPYTPDVEMLDVPPLGSSRRSASDIIMSLMRSGSLPDSESLDRQSRFPSSSANPSAASRMHGAYSHEAGDFLDLSRWHSGPSGSERPDPEGSSRSGVNASSHRSGSQHHRNGDARTSQHVAQQLDSMPSGSRPDAANQEDLDLALAMALAAEDDEAASQVMPPPRQSTRFSSNRPRHPGTMASSFIPGFAHSHLAHASSDPMAAITQSLLGGGRFDLESSQALLASLMADFEATRGVHSSSHGMGSGHQDMSYEALTNLEDVKLTAPPELLATMPLDMCLKGGPWDDKACSICQSEYEPDEVIMILPCEHHFHKDCAMEWLGKHSKKCPICKESIGG